MQLHSKVWVLCSCFISLFQCCAFFDVLVFPLALLLHDYSFLPPCILWAPVLSCFVQFCAVCASLFLRVTSYASSAKYNPSHDRSLGREDSEGGGANGAREEVTDRIFEKGQSKRIWGELYKVSNRNHFVCNSRLSLLVLLFLPLLFHERLGVSRAHVFCFVSPWTLTNSANTQRDLPKTNRHSQPEEHHIALLPSEELFWPGQRKHDCRSTHLKHGVDSLSAPAVQFSLSVPNSRAWQLTRSLSWMAALLLSPLHFPFLSCCFLPHLFLSWAWHQARSSPFHRDLQFFCLSSSPSLAFSLLISFFVPCLSCDRPDPLPLIDSSISPSRSSSSVVFVRFLLLLVVCEKQFDVCGCGCGRSTWFSVISHSCLSFSSPSVCCR